MGQLDLLRGSSLDIHRIGFTGTQVGMTPEQKRTLGAILRRRDEELILQCHHGDCVGADAEFHDIVRAMPVKKIVIHPPIRDGMRARCSVKDDLVELEIREPRDYLTRNHDIVDEVDEMFATPRQIDEQMIGSGTWATIRYARRKRRKLTIIYPSGSIRE